MGTGGPALRTERGAGVAATGCLLLLRFLLSAKLLPRWCWCWLCSRFDCKSLRRVRLGDGRGNAGGRERYGVEEGDSGGKGPVAVADAGWGGRISVDSGNCGVFSATFLSMGRRWIR